MSRITVISSDGHVAARMGDYRPYLEARFRPEFEEFLAEYAEHGVATTDPTNVGDRLDPEVARAWKQDVADPGRLDATWSPQRRAAELDREGITAEVLFQDFGTPFVMSSPTRAASLGIAEASVEQVAAGYRAYNRWLADFRSVAPERWLGMAAISFHDVDAAVAEVHQAKSLGFAGIAIPVYVGAPTVTAGRALVGADIFTGARNLLPSLVFGGVLERFPRLTVVFTETHSDWVRGMLARMDHAYERSDLRRDIRDVLPMRPSEYWLRQCYIGSSIFSRAEIAAREQIGVAKMMIGMDFPHSEGAWRRGTLAYLQATFGAVGVPEADARLMLAENAARVYGFDLAALGQIAGRSGLDIGEVLTAPAVEPAWRGDLNRPLIPA